MMRPTVLLAVALCGAVIAFAVATLMKRTAVDGGTPPEPVTVTGRPPAFYLDLNAAERRRMLEVVFPQITSVRADRLGATKDDVALLIGDDDAAQYIVTQFHQRRGPHKYADAGFADIFRLVRHKAFVDPTLDLLEHPFPEVRWKAVQAAETQANPRLGARILEFYRFALGAEDSLSPFARGDAVAAILQCKGDALAPLIAEAFEDPGLDIALLALTRAAELEIPGVEAAARKVAASSPSRRVRLHANMLLARQGDLKATDAVVAALDPKDPDLASEALTLVGRSRLGAAGEALRLFRPEAVGELERMYTAALLRIGDAEVKDEMMLRASSEGPDQPAALSMLAASGDLDVLPLLLIAVDSKRPASVDAVIAGVSASGQKGFLPVVEKLVELPVLHPSELQDAPRVAGPALVPRLVELLRKATEPQAQINYVAWLAQIGGPDARNALLRERGRVRRLVDEQIRLMDLDARRLGQPTPSRPPE